MVFTASLFFGALLQCGSFAFLIRMVISILFEYAISNSMECCIVLIRILSFVIGIISASINYYDIKNYAIIIIILSFLCYLFGSICFVLSSLLSLFMFVGLLIESVVRIFVCKVSCPKSTLAKIELKYQLFRS